MIKIIRMISWIAVMLDRAIVRWNFSYYQYRLFLAHLAHCSAWNTLYMLQVLHAVYQLPHFVSHMIYLMWGYLFIEENFLQAWLLDKTPTFCSQVSLTLIIVSIRIWSYVTLYVITSSLNVDAFMIRLAGVWYRIEFTWLLICQ